MWRAEHLDKGREGMMTNRGRGTDVKIGKSRSKSTVAEEAGRRRVVKNEVYKSIGAVSAAKKNSHEVRSATLKGCQASRDRESRSKHAEEGIRSGRSPQKKHTRSLTAHGIVSQTVSPLKNLQMSGRTGGAPASKKITTVLPVADRVAIKADSTKNVERIIGVHDMYGEIEPKERMTARVHQDGSSQLKCGSSGERSLRAQQCSTLSEGCGQEGRSVVFNRNPIWPVVYNPENLSCKVVDGAEKGRWRVDRVEEGSPKSVLDRGHSSPDSVEEDSNEHGISGADGDESHSCTTSADSLECSSVAFMAAMETEGVEPDLLYVRRILVTSGFGSPETSEGNKWHSDHLPINPALFDRLETGFSPSVGHKGGASGGEERRQRKLLFHAVNEALGRRLRAFRKQPVWQNQLRGSIRPRPYGTDLVQEVWYEILDWPAPSSEEMYDTLDDAARRDMSKGLYQWTEFGVEEGEVVCAIEEEILEELMEVVVKEFREIEMKRKMRRAKGGCM